LLNLSETKFGIFEECVTDLADAGLLNAESFQQVYSSRIFHIPKVKVSKITCTNTLLFRKLTIDGGPEVYVRSKASKEQSHDGMFGHVNLGFDQKPSQKDDPSWSVKTLHPRLRDGTLLPLNKRLKKSKREVKCNRLLGREAFFFQACDHVKMALAWQPGATLYKLRAEIHKFTFLQRLEWLVNLLQDLSNLHAQFVVHKDLHSGNVIIDLKNSEAAIIDFGMASKTGPGWLEMSSDMIAFEVNIIRDLFQPEFALASGQHFKAINRLSTAVHTPTACCTSEQALNYCRLLVEKSPELPDEEINAIAIRTLDRENLTVNDVLCGSRRPFSMRR
jgi:serine/threonine protein kinase